ncbi:TRAPP II complex [Gilbertella persicaria]|uniref:TRAPP II complex n=1 Tax=Gilbertella persicaria TaxID=101096 RepID=UPI00221F49DA|nr:TRAPP II complex [Gilbertella persicaria]KAI8075820.1 TRAPP II complex [Gilbertella persicaria]
MELALDITSSCRVRVLLIPVSPIKKSKFWSHVELVRKFSLVRLGDVTPNLHKGANARFSSQVFQEGQMHFQFVTKYDRDHSHLEDFQPHRRIFGVIGIMDCQEWKDKDLSEGYKKFHDMLGQYPTAVATRCFAFDPNENQPDDTKGLIMIPNVGNMSFYMSTMICDFASEILDQFASIADRIEKLKMLESPIPMGFMPLLQPQPSVSMTPPSPPSPGPTPTGSVSASFLKRASTSAANNRKSTINAANSPPTPKPSLSRSTTFTGSLNSSSDINRTIQRTPGRIKKLFADFYLLAGRLPDAMKHYQEAIDMTQSSSDYLWLGSAKEGLACTMILMAYLHTDVGHIVSRQSIQNEEDPTPSTIVKPETTLVTEITQLYEDLVQSYIKVNSTTNIPIPKLVLAESCLKIARFLMSVFLNGGWNDSLLTRIVQSPTLQVTRETRFISMAELVKYKGSGIARFTIANWVSKLWTMDMHNMNMMDQINIMTQMSSILSTIGYHRKAAWYMYETLNRMIPLLIQGRATMANGIKHVTIESNVHDGGALQMIQNRFDGQEKTKDITKKNDTVGFGWAALQIDILRECIVISEAIQDHASMLYYTTVLLKNLYQHISKEEQIRLASSIQRIVNISKRSGQVDNSVNYWGFNIVKSIQPIPPIPRKAIYQHPLLIAKAIAASKEDRTNSGDPFIYNPFAKKKDDKPQINLIKDEACEFKAMLTNPFGFDLELSNIVLSTSGIEFSAVPTAATIPANDTLVVRLMGTPLETGLLVIRGCIIKITGFAEQEFLNEKQETKKVEQPKNSKDIVQQSKESERFKYTGLQALCKSSGIENTTSNEKVEQQLTLNVIEDQPLLKIKSTSLLHGAVMLFEGEMKHITIDVENIGNIPVDFLTLSFTDSTTLHPKQINPELPSEEQYEIELYTKGTPVFSWEGSKPDSSQIGKRINLPPGERTQIIVNIYGKQGCTGGAIHVDYGYLDRAIKDQTKKASKFDQELPATLYTRQLYLPVMITVYQNLEPLNWDVLYLRDNMMVTEDQLNYAVDKIEKLDMNHMQSTEQPVEQLLVITQQANDDNDKNPYCLLTLDVRNTWTIPFDIEFTIDNTTEGKEEKASLLKSTVTIQPALTKRMVLPLKKLFLTSEERLQPIPSFEPNKQFVVSQAPKMAPEQERAHLQMFWYREQLLARIKAHWRCPTSKRSGIINLRPSLRLTSLQLSVLKRQDIEFIVDMTQQEGAKTMGHRQFACQVNTFVHMNVTIANRQGMCAYSTYYY